jgi:hypothetical protein
MNSDQASVQASPAGQAVFMSDGKTPSTLSIIQRIESSGGPLDNFALRFEPRVYSGAKDGNTLTRISARNHCTFETARVLYSMSFGAFQMMGFNLYGFLNIQIPIGEYLSRTTIQDQTFAEFCFKKHIAYTGVELRYDSQKRSHFADVYNGNAEKYSLAISQAIAEMVK